jgi:desulfoferrodoxin-like iron-binding protein
MGKGDYKQERVYRCQKCGNTVQLLSEGGGNLICCVKAMSEDKVLSEKYATKALAEESSKKNKPESLPQKTQAPAPEEEDFDFSDIDDIDVESSDPTQEFAFETLEGSQALTPEELQEFSVEECFNLTQYDSEKPVEIPLKPMKNMKVTLVCLGELQTLDLHYHPHHHESVFILEGRGYVYLGDRTKRQEIRSGSFFTLPQNIRHGFKNTQTSEMILLWFHYS